MTFWKKLPIAAQFSLLLAASVALGTYCAYEIGATIYVTEARNQARTVADMVDNVGTWASQYKGIWVRSEPADPGFRVGDFLEREAASLPAVDGAASRTPLPVVDLEVLAALTTAFHRKNPALVQRELSEVTQTSAARAKFRMTSDKFMNPNNAPTRFELAAIRTLRGSDQSEYSEVSGRQLLYARKLVATAACLKCHESPEKAPAVVRAKYGQTPGFGYKEGEVAGVISVAIPLDYAPTRLLRDFGWRTWGAIAAFVGSTLLILVYVQRSIITPVRLLKLYAERAAHSELGRDVGRLQFVDDEHGSHNEVHRLSAAIKAMYASIKLLHQQGRDAAS